MNTAIQNTTPSTQILRRFTAWIALLLLTSVAQAADIVDTAYVADALSRGAIIWDVRDATSYKAGHIPGAVNVGDVSSVLRDPNREDWLPVEQMQAILGRAGIDITKKEVIVLQPQW